MAYLRLRCKSFMMLVMRMVLGREKAKQFNGTDFRGVDGLPNWEEMARYCQVNNSRLGDKETKFVNDMAARTVWREPTEKQAKWLKSIFLRLGGKL
jgi:hypothetical protein